MFCFTSIHNCISLLFRKITHICGPVWFKRMPESTGRGNYYHRGIQISRYLIAAFLKSANYKIYSHFCLIFAYYFVHFFLYLFLFFLLIFYFLFIFFGISSIFHKFYTHITYSVYTHICALCTKLTKTQKRQNINCCLYPLKNRTKSRNFTIFSTQKSTDLLA